MRIMPPLPFIESTCGASNSLAFYKPCITAADVVPCQIRDRPLIDVATLHRTQIYMIDVEGESFPLFSNAAISRRLNAEARRSFLDDLVAQGSADWLDKDRRSCLVLWKKVGNQASRCLR